MRIQTRKQSLVESIVNVVVGYGVAFLSNILVLPIFGVHISLQENFWLTNIFTVISIVRSFVVRRFFNRSSERKLGNQSD